MITRCERGLGWPVEDEPVVDSRDAIVAQLEELREETAPDWSPQRAVWNFAVLIAKGQVRKRKR